MSELTKQDTFLPRLQKIVENRGKRASLRRYWSDTTQHQAYPALGELGSLGNQRTTVLAALYAEHPTHKEGIGIGKAALLLGDRKDGNHPFDAHFRRLLACDDLDDLAQQLHRLVKRLARESVGLDYTQLQKNLNYWGKYKESVKLEWARDFWQAALLETTQPTAES
jgi:CRISPR type I-E-associated protein CasB/Cse2